MKSKRGPGLRSKYFKQRPPSQTPPPEGELPNFRSLDDVPESVLKNAVGALEHVSAARLTSHIHVLENNLKTIRDNAIKIVSLSEHRRIQRLLILLKAVKRFRKSKKKRTAL